jgi:hypothetical protein
MAIATLLESRYSLNQAERAFREGLIDRTDLELFRFYWRNSAPRFSNECWRYDLDQTGLPEAR